MEVTKEIYIDGNLIENNSVKLYYKGKFTREFSNEVFINFGYGPNWDNKQEQKMTWIGDCFFSEIKLQNAGELNFCFRNDFNSWDNNDCRNYTIFVETDSSSQVAISENYEEIIENVKQEDKCVENIVDSNDEYIENVSSSEEYVENILNSEVEPDEKEIVREEIENKVETEIENRDTKHERQKQSFNNKKKEKFKRAVSKKDKKSRKQKKLEKNRPQRVIIPQTQTDNEESLFECFSAKKNIDVDAELAINTIVNSERKEIRSTKKKPKRERVKANYKRYKKGKVKKEVRIVCGIALMCCVTYSTFYFIETRDVQSQSNLLNTIVVREAKNPVNGVSGLVETERMIQVKELNNQYTELKGWLEIEGTNINYPIMQGTDNSYYMTHDYKKEYSKWGSLFLDKDYDFSLPSSNLLIYGHNFSDGVMFADLLKYKDREFFEEHPVIKFTTPEEDAEYEIISVFYSRVYYKSEKDVFRYYYFVNASNETEYNEFVTNAKNVSIYDTGKTAEYGDQLLTLSTCEYSQEDGRFVVVARKK